MENYSLQREELAPFDFFPEFNYDCNFRPVNVKEVRGK